MKSPTKKSFRNHSCQWDNRGYSEGESPTLVVNGGEDYFMLGEGGINDGTFFGENRQYSFMFCNGPFALTEYFAPFYAGLWPRRSTAGGRRMGPRRGWQGTC